MYLYEYNRDKENCFLIGYEPSISINKHFHNCMEFVYVIDGEANAHIDGLDYSLSQGQLCAVSCFSAHYYTVSREGRFIVCLIPRRFFREYESLFNTSGFKNPIIDDNSEKFLLNILQMAIMISEKRNMFGNENVTYSDKFAEDQLHFLSAYLVNLCINTCGLHERRRISSLVADAVGIVEDNFRDNLTILSICKKLGCSQKDLSYHFKKTMGMSIINYIDRTRIMEATRLLNTNPDMTIETVMMQSGFNSNRSFLRHFKDTWGCTPTEYKNANKN